MASAQNPFILAADNPRALIALLQEDRQLASRQDEHGYSLLHAAASYNHLDVLRALKAADVNPNILDEDGETALFVVETVEAAQCLLEEVGTDPAIKDAESMTAEEKIRGEGDFVVVADYLRTASTKENGTEHPPPLPPGVQVRIGSLEDEQSLGEVADPELKQRIDELASREDFQSEESQRELRDVITDAVRGINDRDVRRRAE